jgi:hypothetical protein
VGDWTLAALVGALLVLASLALRVLAATFVKQYADPGAIPANRKP